MSSATARTDAERSGVHVVAAGVDFADVCVKKRVGRSVAGPREGGGVVVGRGGVASGSRVLKSTHGEGVTVAVRVMAAALTGGLCSRVVCGRWGVRAAGFALGRVAARCGWGHRVRGGGVHRGGRLRGVQVEAAGHCGEPGMVLVVASGAGLSAGASRILQMNSCPHVPGSRTSVASRGQLLMPATSGRLCMSCAGPGSRSSRGRVSPAGGGPPPPTWRLSAQPGCLVRCAGMSKHHLAGRRSSGGEEESYVVWWLTLASAHRYEVGVPGAWVRGFRGVLGWLVCDGFWVMWGGRLGVGGGGGFIGLGVVVCGVGVWGGGG